MSSTNANLNSLDACNPALNATVSASAGSGKTWLLITRIVRLLIAGAEPGNIIALTFTRKAAAEMQIRLNQRLFEMATANDEELEDILKLIGCDNKQTTKTVARGLYEKLMHCIYPIRIQTFHSFCQDILSRFPLEADIPPGFDLTEDTSLLERQAWQTLFEQASPHTQNRSGQQPADTQLTDSLDFIMQVCNGPDNTHTALRSFLSHRSDWWAYSAHTSKPVAFACAQLAKTFQLDEQALNKNPVEQFLNDITVHKLKIFASLLREIKNKTSEKHADIIDDALNNAHSPELKFSLIKSAFIKQDGDVLQQGRQLNPTLEKKLGNENASSFIKLHHEISENIQQLNEQLKRLLVLKINRAWYFAGHHYVEIFQQLKRQMRLLDFTDLEWKCYELLQHADNAHWVQYKIDQRIDHILIDEFQDTNPTQWHLLSPILDEIAANPEQRERSVFLVGDEKQSIYSFRRANPALQAQASKWLADNLNARATPLDFSRRSSAAVINCVNRIFEQPDIAAVMTGYTTHDTYLNTLPGQVLLCDLFDANKDIADDEQAVCFRNPLKQPRLSCSRTPRHEEAEYIAKQVLQLKQKPHLITENGAARCVEFGDIMILMRNRTHISIYEEALKQLGIPFIGSKKGGLLDNLEIRDLSCLLNTLITPFDNLALAQVLKSPVFAASDSDLIALAEHKHSAHWYERLLQLAGDPEVTLSKPLQRASKLLPHWQTLAQRLPVHDCLDKIFSEGNIIKRYIAANRTENQQKVAANCQRFLELSLETDSGRYPSISRFLQRLQHLQNYSDNPPEEPLSQSNESRVRLMTIHASKGLEAPVVFLADCNSTASSRNAYASLVRWPANEARPVNFQLQLNKDNTDQLTEKLQQEKLGEQAREELNLLYVALTRAREQLYISGVQSSKSKDHSWYQIISRGLESITTPETTIDNIGCRTYRYLQYDKDIVCDRAADHSTAATGSEIDHRLLKPLPLNKAKIVTMPDYMIAPSMLTNEHNLINHLADEKPQVDNAPSADIARWRGTMIHRFIELLCNAGQYPASAQLISETRQQLTAEAALHKPAYPEYLEGCIQEAIDTFHFPEFVSIFNPEAAKTYNEMPLMYKQGKQTVYGIVDRVIKTENNVFIIDYKSHQIETTGNQQDIVEQFRSQLDYYRNGIKKIWPEYTSDSRNIKAGILLTQNKEIIWLD